MNSDGVEDFAIGAFGEQPPGSSVAHGALWVYSGRDCPSKGYCIAKINSQGCLPTITSLGVPLAAGGADDFRIVASDVLNMRPGLYFWGVGPVALPFGGGTLCVAPPLVRTPTQSAGGTTLPAIDCTGTYSFAFTQAYMTSKGLTVGSTVFGQFYSRDTGFAAPNDVGLTAGLEFTVCP